MATETPAETSPQPGGAAIFEDILTQAFAAADEAIAAEIAIRPENPNALDCGFAWVTIYATQPLARYCISMVKTETSRRYGSEGQPREWQFWCPGKFSGQSIRILKVGAKAFRDALARHGIRASVGSRID